MLMFTLGATNALDPGSSLPLPSVPPSNPQPPAVKKLLLALTTNVNSVTQAPSATPGVAPPPPVMTFPVPVSTQQPTAQPELAPTGTPQPQPPSGQVYPSSSSSPEAVIQTPPDGMLPVEAVKRVPKWAWLALGVTIVGGTVGLILSR